MIANSDSTCKCRQLIETTPPPALTRLQAAHEVAKGKKKEEFLVG
jgi:hypothetical protein